MRRRDARRPASRNYKLIPGVEMGTDIEGAEVHMLGLFLHPDDDELQQALRTLREGRVGRGFGIVEKLRAMGIMIEWERVQQIAGEASVGRPHIAQALVEAGYVSKVSEAFDKWIARNGPAYVERDKMTPEESVRFIVERGGIAIMAHPRELPGFETLLPALKAAGMAGIEVYYKDYPPDVVERLRSDAERFDLLPLGGSDYHGIFGNEEPLPGNMLSPVPESSIERLLELASKLPNRELAV